LPNIAAGSKCFDGDYASGFYLAFFNLNRNAVCKHRYLQSRFYVEPEDANIAACIDCCETLKVARTSSAA
jgi:hypothetical protein